MNKTTLTTTSKYGTFTRKTARTYTHVVIVNYGEGWKVANWCGRYDLAAKASADWVRRYPGDSVVAIVPVDK